MLIDIADVASVSTGATILASLAKQSFSQMSFRMCLFSVKQPSAALQSC
jgi:hypothetical protein